MIYGTKRNFVPADTHYKVPLDKEHYPYALDDEDFGKLVDEELVVPKRSALTEPEAGTYPNKGSMIDYFYPFTNVLTGQTATYNSYFELFKDQMNSHSTIYRPEHENKRLAFQALNPEQLRNDKVVMDNIFESNPLTADLVPDVPEYLSSLTEDINVTEDRLKEFSIILYF
jgi:hypothetical protein